MHILSGAQKLMKNYVFSVVLEPDVDFDGNPNGWHAHAPDLKAAAAWGATPDEALANVRTVIEMTLESMIAHGEPLPAEAVAKDARLTSDVVVSI